MNEFNWDASVARCVDGELTITEQNELILRCEAEPQHFRDVALAFIEQQQLRDALSRHPRQQGGEASVIRDRTERPASRWLAMACGFVLLIGGSAWVAYETGRWNAQTARVTLPSVPEPNPPSAPMPAPIDVQVIQPVIERVSLPPVDAVEMQRATMAMRRPFVPDDSRRRIRELGFDVKERTSIDWVVDDDGRAVPVPFRNVLLQYVRE